MFTSSLFFLKHIGLIYGLNFNMRIVVELMESLYLFLELIEIIKICVKIIVSRLGGHNVNSIRGKDLSKQYSKVLAADGVSFNIDEGEIFALIGQMCR